MQNDLFVDATGAKFIATARLDGDMFSLDYRDHAYDEQITSNRLITVSWTGGEFNMAKAKVSTVVPITSLTPAGREGSRKTADALSIRGGYMLVEVIVDSITVIGTETTNDVYYLAGGDSGILMGGALKATIKNNRFFGIRDAAIYLSAAGEDGEYGDHFTIVNNTIERAYDGITVKRGADNIKMIGNEITDVAVGLSIKNLYAGRTATNVLIKDNVVRTASRPISVQRGNNVRVEGNRILDLGAMVAGQSASINPHGNQFEAISLDGVQGTNLIRNNRVEGVDGPRQELTTTYGVVTRFYDGRETSGVTQAGNHFSRLDECEVNY